MAVGNFGTGQPAELYDEPASLTPEAGPANFSTKVSTNLS